MKTITTAQPHGWNIGDKFTIAGQHEWVPDRRWWPRLKAWLLRRPAPMMKGPLKVFRVTEVISPSTMGVEVAIKEKGAA